MAVLELEKTQSISIDNEAQKHNAMISERYRRLQDAEADQFGSSASYTQSVSASVATPEKTVSTTQVSAPAFAQEAKVVEYVRSRIETPVFTTEKFATTVQDTVVTPITPAPVEICAPTQAVQEEQYSLTRMAKAVMVAFATLVMVMLTVICINTHIINRKTIRIQNLEEKRQELIEQNAEIQRRIQNAQSEDTIREFALSQGMILGE